MASGQAALASLGATPFANFANITASLANLPQSFSPYIDGLFEELSRTSGYLESTTGLSPTALYSTAGALLVLGALPAVVGKSTQNTSKPERRKRGLMSRFGWSSGGQLSPYSSNLGPGGVPAVTEDDYTYITSKDLENHGLADDRQSRRGPRDSGSTLGRSAPETPEDDILLVKNDDVVYPERFPAYSIGDGKLLVEDVRDRVKMVMQLSDRRSARAKLLYKGRQLKDVGLPVRDYGIKNNSEIMVVLGDAESGTMSNDADDDIGRREDAGRKKSKKRRRGKKQPSGRSPPDSGSSAGSNVSSNVGSNTGLEVPQQEWGRPQSPGSGVSGHSGFSAASSVPGGPLDQVNAISAHFATELLPLCERFTANPPSDPKKRQDEHRRISETIMEHVILKLDGVDTGGDEDVRLKRKEVIGQIQEALKGLDSRLKG